MAVCAVALHVVQRVVQSKLGAVEELVLVATDCVELDVREAEHWLRSEGFSVFVHKPIIENYVPGH